MWNVAIIQGARAEPLLGCNVSHSEALFWCNHYEDKYPNGHMYGTKEFKIVPIPMYEGD